MSGSRGSGQGGKGVWERKSRGFVHKKKTEKRWDCILKTVDSLFCVKKFRNTIYGKLIFRAVTT